MFSFVCALPSPTSAEGCPPLFGWFTGTTTQSDFSSTCMSAVRLLVIVRPRRAGDLPVLVHVVSQRARVLRLRRTGSPLAINVVAVLPSSYSEWSRHPDLRAFRSSIAPPTDASVYASRDTSRCPQQDSRSGWIRYFLSCRALASPTTCRFIPALAGLPVIGCKCQFDSRFPAAGYVISLGSAFVCLRGGPGGVGRIRTLVGGFPAA